MGGYHTSQAPFIVSASTVADCLRYSLFTCCNLHTNEDCKTNENARVSVSAGRLFAVLFIHLWQFATNENAGNVEKIRNASASISAVGTLYSPVAICNKRKCRNCKQNRNAGASISAGRLLAVLFIHLL